MRVRMAIITHTHTLTHTHPLTHTLTHTMNISEDVVKKEPLYPVSGNVNQFSHCVK